MKEILAIIPGGGFGASSRHGITLFVNRFASWIFPPYTMPVNMRRSFMTFSAFARDKTEKNGGLKG